MALIIEELNRAQRVQTRYRMDGDRFTIGRGYDNDAILEDVHADAHHVEIVRSEDGGYLLRDRNSVNGTQLMRNQRETGVEAGEVSERRIVSGDEIQLGRTHFRLVDTEEPMDEAVPLHSLENLFSRLASPVKAVSLLVLAGLLTLLIAYLGTAEEFRWTGAINIFFGSIFGLLVYAGAWALIGRVVHHESMFFTQLAIAALGALIFAGWEWFSTFLDYNFAMGNLVEIINVAILAMLLPAMLWSAIYLATNITPKWRLAAAVILPWGFLGLTLLEQVGNMAEFDGIPQISTEIKHKDMLVRSPVPLDEFVAKTPSLFDIPIEQEDKAADEAATESEPEAKAANGDDSTHNHTAGSREEAAA
ncbi:FHA domain-containing protein [Microbulbifer guangxiensis]|uniref:FHA domain-containing protein n=1 Tax=Microbulbifer guangxiensis TaxID=2904249 RepID=UPI001F273DF8|nr:FHA domain-containing protein [Microbulbifer guangxiensis]